MFFHKLKINKSLKLNFKKLHCRFSKYLYIPTQEGKFTYYTSLGNSAIDLTLVDVDYLPKILSFKVEPPNEFSHHCKIVTKLACQSIKNENTSDDSISKSQFNKFIWEGDISKAKLLETVSSPSFLEKKQAFLARMMLYRK